MSKREKVFGVITIISIIVFMYIYMQPHISNKNSQKENTVFDKKEQTGEKKLFDTLDHVEQDSLDTIIKKLELLNKEIENVTINDPFMKPQPIQENPQISLLDLKFLGIIWHKGKSLAIINEQLYGQGDSLLGFEIVEIKTNEVLLSKDGEIHMLRLFPEYLEKREMIEEDIKNGTKNIDY